MGLYSQRFSEFFFVLFLKLFLAKNCFVNRILFENKKILSIKLLLYLSVILIRILRIFVNTDPDHNNIITEVLRRCQFYIVENVVNL